MDGILGHPDDGEEEADGLLEVRDEEIVDQDNILVVSRIAPVISSPEEQSESYESDESSCGDN